jgi:hypothetical protein
LPTAEVILEDASGYNKSQVMNGGKGIGKMLHYALGTFGFWQESGRGAQALGVATARLKWH